MCGLQFASATRLFEAARTQLRLKTCLDFLHFHYVLQTTAVHAGTIQRIVYCIIHVTDL